MTTDEWRGPLALVGGGEWTEGADFDADLLEQSDGEVLILPTAAAYEYPDRAVERATSWFNGLGATVEAAMVLNRRDAENEAFAAVVRASRFTYLCGGSPLHLKAVLKDSAVLHGLLGSWHDGAVIAGSGAGAMVLTDPMVDPRGGAFTVGCGFVRDVAVTPHYEGEITTQLRRTLTLAPEGCAVVALGERGAIIREPDGTWRHAGSGRSAVFLDDQEVGLEALAGKPVS